MEKHELEGLTLAQLRELAKQHNIKSITTYKKDALIEVIIATIKNLQEQEQKQKQENQESENLLSNKSNVEKVQNKINQNEKSQNEKVQNEKTQNENQETKEISGILEVLPDGFGFIRTEIFESGDNDVFVSPVQIRRFKLKTGDFVKGLIRPDEESDNFPPLIYVLEINGHGPENMYKRPNFEDLKPIYPKEGLNLIDNEDNITNRLISLTAPIGKGQRGLIVSPPKTGKTTIIKSLANAIEKNHPEVKIFILLIDERPEEVTDIERSVNKYTKDRKWLFKTEVVASTFDEQVENHARISELTLERAKRFVEEGHNVVILLDSITRMARAYNILTPSSGKTLSGGLDPLALYKPKRFFGAARNIEKGGSLSIIATCLIDTGSRMDDMIYEEFKGTGNMELHLDRNLSEISIFPAIDIIKSGTRRDDLLQNESEREAMVKIRRLNKDARIDQSMHQLLKLIKNSKDNKELIKLIKSL